MSNLLFVVIGKDIGWRIGRCAALRKLRWSKDTIRPLSDGQWRIQIVVVVLVLLYSWAQTAFEAVSGGHS